MPAYKLVYFDIRGRAEISRLVLAQAGQDFEDRRYHFPPGPDWFGADKEVAPFQQLPYLKVDEGKPGAFTVSQSLSIARYLARRHDLMGSSVDDEAKIDALFMAVNDAVELVGQIFWNKDQEEVAAELRKKLVGRLQTLDFEIEKLELGEAAGPLVGGAVSLADLYLFCLADQLVAGGSLFAHLPSYPRIEAQYQFVGELPRIKEWLAKRPASPL